ncbi:hypothetical protein GCM10009738_03640 [Kitasatospora viridis]|uniref:Uncharacterized protein n=1 Tax=Kitasatospora viridis TaxID=281105 RepID=A0A561SFT5_9ACTN|nr:hypothetical protein FHX73_15368 [Kitasatospora viridis]
MTSSPSSARRGTGLFASALLALGMALTGLAGTAQAAGSAPDAASHPASAGWVQTHGDWVQVQPGHPHAALSAHPGAATGPTTHADPVMPIVPVNNDQPNMAYRGGQDSVGVTSGPPQGLRDLLGCPVGNGR